MKIVYNIRATCNSGGMERVLANKANYLAKLGHQVCIVTTDQRGRKPFFSLDDTIALYDLGINYGENNGKSLAIKFGSYWYKQQRHRAGLAKLLRRLKADIVISMFDPEASFLASMKDGSKKILEIHFSRYKRLQYGRKGPWKWVDAYRSRQDLAIAKKYDRFVVLTEEDKGYWKEVPSIRVIPNAHSFKPKENAPLQAKRVIAVGRYDYQKGFYDLIKIWQTVHLAHREWTLTIFGDGPLAFKLQALIDRFGLTHVITLHPPVKNIMQEYLNSSVLVMTSLYEGLPMALLEAQACGVPLLSYACKCGPRDIIVDGENGFLVEEGDRKDFAKKLMQLMVDEDLRQSMGRKALDRSLNFSEKEIMEKWLNLFGELSSPGVGCGSLK